MTVTLTSLRLLYRSALIIALLPMQTTLAAAQIIGFEQSIQQAQQNDPWLAANHQQQSAIEAKSIAAATLPDPMVSVSVANLPTNGFSFDQEGMTQFKVGVSQQIPRGDSLAFQQAKLEAQGQMFPYQREQRKAQVRVTVGKLWLDTYLAQQSIALINKNYSLFHQLTEVAEASYASALGKTRQQDIIRAQLELTRLDDRLTVLTQGEEVSLTKLVEWLRVYEHQWQPQAPLVYRLPDQLPDILPDTKVTLALANNDVNAIASVVMHHPAVKVIEQNLSSSKHDIALAKEQHQPLIALNASYSYRADDPMGRSRADFLSVGVSFDLPLFTENKQDQQVKAAVSQAESIKISKLLVMRELISGYQAAVKTLQQLDKRQQLYQQTLLPQVHQQAEASLTAYTNDDGDFAEVVRARIAELNAEIDALTIKVNRQKALLDINYYLLQSTLGEK